MAGVPITIVGTITDNEGAHNATVAGIATITGLEIGGGPIEPGEGPPSIWPSPGHPAHPIVIPPTIWPQPPNPDRPHPEHPIVIPPPPDIPQAPPLEVKVIWVPAGENMGWQVILVPTGEHPAPSQQGGSRRR